MYSKVLFRLNKDINKYYYYLYTPRVLPLVDIPRIAGYTVTLYFNVTKSPYLNRNFIRPITVIYNMLDDLSLSDDRRSTRSDCTSFSYLLV